MSDLEKRVRHLEFHTFGSACEDEACPHNVDEQAEEDGLEEFILQIIHRELRKGGKVDGEETSYLV